MLVLRLLPLSLLLFAGACLAELEIGDGWIKHLPATVPVRAGYLTLSNTGSSTLTIVGVSSDSFASVEIHRSVQADGMMRMQRVERLSIAPGETVQLAPGGLHLMLMQPRAPTEPGQTRRIEIEFADGSRQNLQLTVRK